MILTAVLLGAIVLMMIFSIYIIGLISSKMDLIVYYMKMLQADHDREEKNSMQKQFMGMMNYTAEDWRDTDE